MITQSEEVNGLTATIDSNDSEIEKMNKEIEELKKNVAAKELISYETNEEVK